MTIWSLCAAVALLLWATHMVTTGVLRGFGAPLRRILAAATDRRWRLFGVGLGVTVLLQSSTATGLMAAAFAAEGALPLTAGSTAMLGANVGTALVARALVFPVAQWAGIPMLVGYILFRRRTATDRVRQAGRALMGLGMMLWALHALAAFMGVATTDPLGRLLLSSALRDPVLVLVMAAILAWAAHSSIATMLALTALQTVHPLPAADALAAVLGTNIGGALPPLLETTGSIARRLPLGNVLVRTLAAVIAAATAPLWLPSIPPGWSRAPFFLADIHVLFNVAAAAMAWPLVDRTTHLLTRLLPDPQAAIDPGQPRHLDPALVDQGYLAVSQAERETLRLATLVQEMARQGLAATSNPNPRLVPAVRTAGQQAARLAAAIRRYLERIPADGLGDQDRVRASHLVRWVFDLDQAAEAATAWTTAAHRARHAPLPPVPILTAASDDLRTAFACATAVVVTADRRAARALIDSKAAWRLRETEWGLLPEALRLPPTAHDAVLTALRELRQLQKRLCGPAYQICEQDGLPTSSGNQDNGTDHETHPDVLPESV